MAGRSCAVKPNEEDGRAAGGMTVSDSETGVNWPQPDFGRLP